MDRFHTLDERAARMRRRQLLKRKKTLTTEQHEHYAKMLSKTMCKAAEASGKPISTKQEAQMWHKAKTMIPIETSPRKAEQIVRQTRAQLRDSVPCRQRRKRRSSSNVTVAEAKPSDPVQLLLDLTGSIPPA